MIRTWKGLPARQVQAEGFAALIVPELGGKVVSLLTEAGVELLVNRDLVPALPIPGARFVDAPLGGWDECVPTIDECSGPDQSLLPDHGEAWRVPWGNRGADWYGYRGRALPYDFSRRASCNDGRLRFDYRVSAVGDVGVGLLWAAHPQFAAPQGTVVLLPPGVTSVLDVLAPVPAPHTWADAGLGIDEVPLPGPDEPGYRKYYLDPGQRIHDAQIVRPDGITISMTWGGAVVPYLGIWMDQSVFAREAAVGLEPSTGFFDSHARASAQGRLPLLAPGDEIAWHVELEVAT